MMKYTSNTWHALKVCFANEIGNLCKKLGVDSHEVMDIFCQRREAEPLAVLPEAGLRVRRLVPAEGRARAAVSRQGSRRRAAGHLGDPAEQPAADSSTRIDQVLETGKKKVGLLGFSFKAGTDDLRESPIVILAEALLGKGCSLRIYDKNVSLAQLVGANKDYIEKQIPHLSSLLCRHDRRGASTAPR